jgi:hypothetical protein
MVVLVVPAPRPKALPVSNRPGLAGGSPAAVPLPDDTRIPFMRGADRRWFVSAVLPPLRHPAFYPGLERGIDFKGGS